MYNKKIKMKDSKELKLIDGKFTTEEASEILLNLYGNKIQFHELKNFSSQERFQKEDAIAIQRIPELKVDMETVVKLIKEAIQKNQKLEIKSFIQISLSSSKN